MKHLFLRLFSTNSEERLEILPRVWSCCRPFRIGQSRVDRLHTPVVARYIQYYYISERHNYSNIREEDIFTFIESLVFEKVVFQTCPSYGRDSVLFACNFGVLM